MAIFVAADFASLKRRGENRSVAVALVVTGSVHVAHLEEAATLP